MMLMNMVLEEVGFLKLMLNSEKMWSNMMVVPGPVNSNIHYWTTLICKPQRAGNGGPLDVTPLKRTNVNLRIWSGVQPPRQKKQF